LKNPNFNDYIKKKMLLEDEEMQLSDFYYISYLGKGTFGYVCLVHNELAFYAIKAINREAAEKRKNGVNNIVNEKKCMIALDHPFIVNFVKTMKNNNWVFILEEYIKGKNFEDYLESRKSTKSMKELIFYGGCLFHMLKYLTKRRIMHRDIKPKNIMIDTGGYLKLLDFGCSRKIKFFTKTIVGTPNYISPEVLKGKEYSFTCDYWSVGVCCYFIYFGKLPFGEKTSNVMQIYKEIINKEITIPKDCPLAVKDLIENLLKKNIGERIHNFEEVKECQLFKDFDWDNLLRKKLRPFFIPTGEDLGGRVNLKNLASPFDKFIKNEWVETSEMHLLKIKNNINDEIQDQVGQNNDNDDLYAENKDEFSINWFDYF
jgi:cGMP-dependent protein kinase